ncbi:MAG: NADH-quinone oxidoreductase subunit NuoH, partial [Nitrospirae bacterium]
PIADGIKLFFKEDIIPEKADKGLFFVSPIIPLVTALISFIVVPIPSWDFLYRAVHISLHRFQGYHSISELNIGIIYLLAVSAVGSYGIILGGWASCSKYSLLGGLRASAQVISYEIAVGLSLIGVMLLAGSANLSDIINAQHSSNNWFIRNIGYIVVQPLAFIIFLISAIAETNRAPFDMPEAESELVAGFATEYSGFRFALFFMAEYIHMVMVGFLCAICFFGGWYGVFPFLPPMINLLIKVYGVVFLFIWLRATLPRVRYDQLMGLGWKLLIPLAFINIILTSIIKLVIE